MTKKIKTVKPNNIVAKFAHEFNKALVFKDKTKYSRKDKHRNFSDSSLLLI